MASKKTKAPPAFPPANDWRTTDQHEVERRRQRAREEAFAVANQDARHPIFSNFRVKGGSGLSYQVEVRSVRDRQFSCECVDFRINGLGTCKHVEAVLLQLQRRFGQKFREAAQMEVGRVEVLPDFQRDTLRVAVRDGRLRRSLAEWFDEDGVLRNCSPEEALQGLEGLQQGRLPDLRISQDVRPWLEERRRAAERGELRREYELKAQSGEWPSQETKATLFPYQREGMLHLAFTERALLADEMGLGKTIQAIAACALLHRLGKARRVLVVTPASLKTEWEEQIQRFTDLPCQLVFGNRPKRMAAYESAPFFTLVNYEQIVPDVLEVNARLRPDVVVLDEAQRIKNWNTKTAQAVKRLRSRYAFVLTGTPIENRIDELHSLMDFLNPAVLGPLFRFNRDFYQFDERGRPSGYRNLDQLHARIKPFMLRRRKAEVETQLPERTDRQHFVPMSDAQRQTYASHEQQVMKLVMAAERRPLTQQEQDKLQRELAMMRMICDTNYILDEEDRECPKLAELEKLLEECRDNDAKVIVFSEWERMLLLVRELCGKLGLGCAWHTGSVPQQRRRGEINLFKNDSQCRVFLSTDSGATGLNLQVASVVINCDLPWNPAKLEQRIARAWRKHQTKPVTVINLVSEGTIEHRMLETLATKQAVAESVLDLKGEKEISIRGGRQAFAQRLKFLVSTAPARLEVPPPKPSIPADRAGYFAQQAQQLLKGALVNCEERYPAEAPHSVVVLVVERDAAAWRDKLAPLHNELFGPGQADPLAPTRFEVIDRATDEAIQRLIEAGLLTRNSRAARPLLASDAPGPVSLSAEEKARAEAHRAQAARKLKTARVLATSDLAEEARAPMREGILAAARALAVENRLPEPSSAEDSLRAPYAFLWKSRAEEIRAFLTDAHAGLPVAAVEASLVQ